MSKKSLVIALLLSWGATSLTPSQAFFEKKYSPLSQPKEYQVVMISKPSPPTLGDNLLEVLVKDTDGKPVSDAEVVYSAVMPGMKMSTDDDRIPTENKKNGRYAAKVNFSMGGKWHVTAHIKRGKHSESKAIFEFNIKWE